jgi:dihydrofolate reductase
MILSAVAAMANNRVIGNEGGLPWSIPEDMKFFRDKTMNHIMLMGRKTFESFPGLLPKRLHVVITRQKDFHPAGAHVFHDISQALEFCKAQTAQWGKEVFIVGGGQIYKELLPMTDRIYLTEIHKSIAGDAYFPELPPGEFQETERKQRFEPVAFDFVTYERIRKN